jgi:hypothetical protein
MAPDSTNNSFKRMRLPGSLELFLYKCIMCILDIQEGLLGLALLLHREEEQGVQEERHGRPRQDNKANPLILFN